MKDRLYRWIASRLPDGVVLYTGKRIKDRAYAKLAGKRKVMARISIETALKEWG